MTVNKAVRREGTSRFLAHFPPSHLANVNMCQCDRGQGFRVDLIMST